jgi:SAM-dependent methyltransferase
MEGEGETIRLDMKTDSIAVRRQALWCGVKPGMRILDAGCGSGKTTMIIREMIQPGGKIVGVDYSEDRVTFAEKKYGGRDGIEFYTQDIRNSMEWLGQFDLVWVRFVLEYYWKGSLDIVKNLIKSVKPGGYLCLIDLDYNCLSHYELPSKMAELLPKIMALSAERFNFDSFVGRKLYSFLYDSGFETIEMNLEAHHLIYGQVKGTDIFNWTKKMEIAAKKASHLFNEYEGGCSAYLSDFERFFLDPRRFTYTPLLLCRGVRPLVG